MLTATDIERLACSVGIDPLGANCFTERYMYSEVLDELELQQWFGDDEATFNARLAMLPFDVQDALLVGIDIVAKEKGEPAETRRSIFWNAAMYADEMRARDLEAMPYDEYLSTPEWFERRTRAAQRAGGRCQVCNAAGKLHIHHRTYERRGRERGEDLTALCPECHWLYHSQGKLASG